jgi:hypothetical protein
MADLDYVSHSSIAPSTPATPCGQGRGRSMAHSSPDFARFLFGCSADTKPYMDCACRRAIGHLNRETAEEAWSQPE